MNHKLRSLVAPAAFILATMFCGAALAQDHSSPTGNQPGQCQGCTKQSQGPMTGMMGQGQGRMQNMENMQTIHALFDQHDKITRTVKNTENGVETMTESDDPKVQSLIAEHAWAMQKLLENKQPIRQWDPLFAELFKYADKIKMEITRTPKGVKVVETSSDAYVVKLMQAHAQGISEFVTEGMPSMHKTHELPGAKKEEKAFLGRGDGITTCPVTGGPINKNISAEINGRTTYFCCASCRDAVTKNPTLYLRIESH
ncbi:MAG TPA: hypothetical protein VLR92_07820 [Blastocatellia bacterium]|nr:hypothetical protein [Blastocatellia bacterium]